MWYIIYKKKRSLLHPIGKHTYMIRTHESTYAWYKNWEIVAGPFNTHSLALIWATNLLNKRITP